MKSWFLVPLLGVLLVTSARADDLNARAAQVKTQLQGVWLPAWATKSPANEGATDAALLLQTLSHAHRLGYSSPQLNALDAARGHYARLRDLLRDKAGDGFFDSNSSKNPSAPKSSQTQAQVVLGLVEYARASNQNEPRGIAIKTWRLLRDRARDKANGGFFDSFLSGPLSPTQASGSGFKSAATHLRLLEAGAQLFALTRDRSIGRDVEELLDLNQGRFFPTRGENAASLYTADWQSASAESLALPAFSPSEAVQAGAIIARAQEALGLPVGWVDFARRTDVGQTQDAIYAGGALDSLSLLARLAPSRERRATQIDGVLDSLNGQTPDVRSGRILLDFVAAFAAPRS